VAVQLTVVLGIYDTQLERTLSGRFSVHSPQSLVLCEFPIWGKHGFHSACRGKLLQKEKLMLCRAHWLLAMHMELQASKVVNNSLDFDRLSKARQHRCCLEELHDNHCQKLMQQYAEQWGVADYRA